mmetsp:Transcript_38976/g.79764  ORF Transcript_38976/g.79764 Transcript_38976/m.79764 type:complete len:116 (+) Transcript_38976:294-641(+)
MKLSILLALAALVQFADGFASTVRSNLQMSGVGLPKPPVVGPKNAAEVKAKFGDKSEFASFASNKRFKRRTFANYLCLHPISEGIFGSHDTCCVFAFAPPTRARGYNRSLIRPRS